jgi:hypothetical protein
MDVQGCGKAALEWGGRGGNSIVVDHLDDDPLNNDPENLVPSCTQCNASRGSGRYRPILNEDDIQAIIALAKCNRLNHSEIGAIFRTSGQTVWRIVQGMWVVSGAS